MAALKERVDKLEEALMRLVYIQQKTEIELQEFKKEMQEFKNEMKAFKDEMLDFKEWSKRNIENLNQQWGKSSHREWTNKNIDTENLNQQWVKLVYKWGTLVEDIFAPSIDQAIEKYFGVSPDVIDIKKLVRKEGKSLEVDILALCEKEKVAYVVEVKANPDRKEYIEDFLKKLKEIPSFLPSLGCYALQGIYAGLNMKEETVKLLTRKKLYAMVFRGDILEIVNFEDVRK